jgi:hypothetical protein
MGNFLYDFLKNLSLIYCQLITKLPNTEQSSKGKGKTHKSINRQQQENWENRNGPDLVQAFPKKWWVESDFMAPKHPLLLRVKGSGCHYNSIFNNTGTNHSNIIPFDFSTKRLDCTNELLKFNKIILELFQNVKVKVLSHGFRG